MKPRQQVSRPAIAMIKRFEGYRRKAAQLPDGRWTIGYGHTASARKGAEVPEQDAEALLIYDLIEVSHAVNEWTFTALTQNQFDALASFVFNIGAEPFRHSLVLRHLNEGALLQAACAMELWRRAEVGNERIVVDALVRRRAAEKALFLTPAGAWVPAPTAVLRPELDIDLTGLVPHQAPEAVETSLEGERVRVRRDLAAFVVPKAPEPAEPNPARAAAEAVTTRLSGLFRELDPAETPAVIPAPPAETPPAEAARPFPLAAGVTGPGPFAPANDLARPVPPHADTPPAVERLDIPGRPPAQSWRDLAPLAVLAALGLALFVGGLYWAFHVAPDAGVSAGGALGVGWLAGVAGIGFFSVAAYRLFERLGQGDGDDALGR
ncbi:lysozyme [Phenylobacterium sp.]|jgi:lysozyme|uniref:lysozyme n=1 Tax=Phenylobacterium sp. TaxID=1871053 RepID=UPI002F407DC8